ncbi:PRC-barrel domain-containing protein [Candidatus Woesearchaeota archaeon]|nr:PRC-barrel domain-containing protein [Candidatus Woesearchaeota archaeon]
MKEDDRKYSKQLLGKTIVSKTGKKFGEAADIEFEMKTGEIIHILLKNPTGYCEGLELEKNKDNLLMVPFSSVIAIGDYIVIAEEEVI